MREPYRSGQRERTRSAVLSLSERPDPAFLPLASEKLAEGAEGEAAFVRGPAEKATR